ncbi:chromosome segregation protein SMC [Butyrivibrio sp. MC2013]|uniref:chromosome segregation protein SMC n=1 Tax=Butyrivibrio sp. MC2013 TaxID=1280686 RepID=UPI00047BD65A|nr:chromosome segregation protein SMC [Butyrivibrio sp. MC2013]
MYLKSIEVHGFKSFANRMKLDFHNGITGIVGPNGSGKSNVADAVRWVLGEQRAKQLRGGSMQDVIFSGTELRRPLGFAFVSITLDNSDRALAIDFDEVTVSRRLYRSGESEYMINSAPCRLKDINELFYDTGIGKEGYSIIGQGQIDQILSSKPEDRRNLFDEAAGIVKFKIRKEAAIRKLEEEKVNLTRLSDILQEQEKQLEPLQKQSETAKIYLGHKERLKVLDINMFLIESARLEQLLDDASGKLEDAEKNLDDTVRAYEEAREEYDKVQAALEEAERTVDNARSAMTDSSVLKEKLEGQLGILREQIRSAAAQAGHFEERKNEISAEISAKDEELSLENAKCSEVDREITSLEEERNTAVAGLEDIRGRIKDITDRIEEAKSSVIESMNKRASIKARQSSIATMKEQLSIRKAELTGRLVSVRSDEAEKKARLDELKKIFEDLGTKIRELEESQKAYDTRLSEIRDDLAASDDKMRVSRDKAMELRSRYNALANMTERYEGYGSAVRTVMSIKDNEKGVIGVVADIIKTDPAYETAIETALGGSIQNIVTDNEDTAKKMISYLKQNRAGRATFLPLTAMEGSKGLTNRDVLCEKGVIGTADTLVNVDDRYKGVAVNLLGRVVVVDNVDNATAAARKYHYSVRMVTLEGELLTPGGAISGGAFKNSSNLLGRRREMDDLKNESARLYAQAEEIGNHINAIKGERADIRGRIEKARAQLQEAFIEQNTARMNVEREEEKQKEETALYENLKEENEDIRVKSLELEEEEIRIRAELSELDRQEEKSQEDASLLTGESGELSDKEEEALKEVTGLDARIAAINQKKEYILENIRRIEGEKAQKKADLEEVVSHLEMSRKESLEKEENIRTIEGTIEASGQESRKARQELEEAQKVREELSGKQKGFFEKREHLAELRSGLDKEVNRLSSQKEKLDGQIEGLSAYMWDEYEITLSSARELRDEEMNDASAMKKEIASLKNSIRALGDVNVNAIEDYKNLLERHDFMKTQHDDLIVARDQLLVIIDDLDSGMRSRFKEQFDLINKQFDKVFKEMFGGGHGSLEIDENEDILEAGIRIIAQPPGKKLVNMNMMSGGEKALTAIALLFAIQNLKPSPFCLLDEIEAALDENNVVRFARYLHKLKNTQFIVITHRRGTMESADRLYGITMQEKGVSALVSVNLIDKELEN